MTKLLVIGITLMPFFLRDVLLLKTGRPADARRRLWLYSASLIVYATLFCIGTESLGLNAVMDLLRSPAGAVAAIVFYGLILAACLWIRRSREYDRAWIITLAPNPLLLIGIAAGSRLLGDPAVIFSSLVTASWIVSIMAFVLWTRQACLDTGDMEHTVDFAGMINAFAFCLIPFESLFGTSDSFPQILRQVIG